LKDHFIIQKTRMYREASSIRFSIVFVFRPSTNCTIKEDILDWISVNYQRASKTVQNKNPRCSYEESISLSDLKWSSSSDIGRKFILCCAQTWSFCWNENWENGLTVKPLVKISTAIQPLKFKRIFKGHCFWDLWRFWLFLKTKHPFSQFYPILNWSRPRNFEVAPKKFLKNLLYKLH